MSSWHELIGKDPSSLKWPYPIRYDVENEVTTDVLVLGGGIAGYIQAEEGYETLLELEQMGGKIRDTHDIFKSSRFRDEATKFLFAYDYDSRLVFRVWGQGFKRALVIREFPG